MNPSSPEIVFWFCLCAVAYNYAGYPLVLFALATLSQAKSDLRFLFQKRTRRASPRAGSLPRVAVLVSAYNEERVIQAKVRNTLELDYPPDRIELLIGLDAPADSTAAMLSPCSQERMQVIHFSHRRGKLRVLCDLANRTSADVLVLTDANTILDRNCIRSLVRHFADPRVGAVSGEEIRVAAPGTDPGAESLYWKYESALKVLESRINCSLGANGSVLAVRRILFHPTRASIVEDFQIPLEIRYRGYRVVYDPEAVATEEVAPTFAAQFARRVRVGAGNFQALFGNPACLHPRNGLLAFCYVSHRVLRWIAPLLLLIALLSSAVAAARPVFAVLFAAQCAFYLAAWIGFRRKLRGTPLGRMISLPFQFCLMNVALLFGFFHFLSGRQKLTWSSTPRALRQDAA